MGQTGCVKVHDHVLPWLASSDLLHTRLALAGTRFNYYYYYYNDLPWLGEDQRVVAWQTCLLWHCWAGRGLRAGPPSHPWGSRGVDSALLVAWIFLGS